MQELEGKTALITGAARGQGRTHALALAREGMNVVVTDLHERELGPVPYPLAVADDLSETVRLIEAEGVKALSLTVDVRDAEAVDGAARKAVEEFGSLDVVCANAGIWAASELFDMTEEQWQTVIDINLTGVFHTVRAAAREMKPQGSGRIICTASTAGRAGMANFGNYVAAKWGVIGLVKTAAIELAPDKITVNAICPACVKTDMMFENQALYGVFRPDLDSPTTEDIEGTIMEALHKLPEPWIEPEEVSDIVVFLASDKGKHITGTGIDITAGLSATWGPEVADAVLTEVRDGVLLITLNRPDARNAVNLELATGVAAAVERLEAEDELRAGVITGAGKGFSSGMDLKAFLEGETPHAGGRGFAGICERPPAKPMIAAVEGFAVAGGLEIALSCDLIVAGRSARLGVPETKRGLIAGAGALIRMPRRIPRNVAMEMALTGDLIEAPRAYELGLVNRVCEDGGAVAAALEIAAGIAANGPLAVRISKQIVDELVELPEAEAWARQEAFIEQIMGSGDAREGAAAFAEKRDPVWTGS